MKQIGQFFGSGFVCVCFYGFSCYGRVTSLNGEAEQGVLVEAVGRGSDTCQLLQEESKSEPDGHFRIRGLQVCKYMLPILLVPCGI